MGRSGEGYGTVSVVCRCTGRAVWDDGAIVNFGGKEHIISHNVICIAMHADLDNKSIVLTIDDNLAYAEMEKVLLRNIVGMYKLDLETLSPKLRKNREVHEILVYVSATCLNSLNKDDKLVVVTSMNKSKKVRSGKRNKKKICKPTSNVFTHYGHRWIPTGRTFTIDGNNFPLTRITSTTVLPPKKPVPAKVVEKTSPIRNNLRKPKVRTSVSSSSKSKIVESKISNNLEPNKNRGYNISTSPSSSRVHFSKFMGTIRFGNDQVTAIIGYVDYHIGKVIISQVYYVEGL
nr:integrase, catalytic region, zinc finger, CCHC-type, peptidase aspartic, catalytic [Tanacetum cinerariifolium]GEZ34803.1 integrase, catalytic region, zinc finger, CCHC-type, peptidase aspartic, catalytic [Tanacetum cinerariifolium]